MELGNVFSLRLVQRMSATERKWITLGLHFANGQPSIVAIVGLSYLYQCLSGRAQKAQLLLAGTPMLGALAPIHVLSVVLSVCF